MILVIDGHTFHFEMENLCRLFFPLENIKVVYEHIIDDITVITSVKDTHKGAECEASIRRGDIFYRAQRTVEDTVGDKAYWCELYLALALFEVLRKFTGATPAWGILTGVRPVKLFHRIAKEQGSFAGAADYFRERFLVSEEKAGLCADTAAVEDEIIGKSRPNSFSLYVSIPFCPTRCSYCSFVSEAIEKKAGLLPEYLDCLCSEIVQTGRLAKELGLRLETVYFGGGTPTILSAGQLERLISEIERCFDLSTVREYTIEAGRPDTITEDKLAVMHAVGVSRISINPQTLRDEVLKKIGRRHTSRQIFDAFEAARRKGFGNINMDIIAGLPSDDYEGFCATLEGVASLNPESVTLHTLYLKRASDMVSRGEEIGGDLTGEGVGEMLRFAQGFLKNKGYHSYYLYRQTRTLGNHENTGWSKPGFEGLYNVYMMDETHTILAVGAGAVSKLVAPNGYIERIFNFKFPNEYIRDFEQILKRKGRGVEFYDSFKEYFNP